MAPLSGAPAGVPAQVDGAARRRTDRAAAGGVPTRRTELLARCTGDRGTV